MTTNSKKPRWTDMCNHPPESYVGTFESYGMRGHELGVYDLYLFKEHFSKHATTKVCIRYGNEVHEYLSIGWLEHLIIASVHNEVYRNALRLLNNEGHISWIRKDKT